MSEKQLLKYVSISILIIAISSVASYIEAKSGLRIGNTTIWWVFYSVIIYLFFSAKKSFFDPANKNNMQSVHWYLMWNICCMIRGVFIADTYWDWKGLLSNSLALLIPVIAYSVSNKNVFQSVLSYYFRYGLYIFFALIVLTPKGAYGFFLVPVGFLLFFLPILPTRWRIISIAFAILVMVSDLGARSNVIKFGLPFVFLLIYYLRHLISIGLLETIRKIFFIIPPLLFFLAVTGTFNVFKMDDYIKGDYTETNKNKDGETVEVNLVADTRTALYEEVLTTARKYDTWWFGRSPARGNETEVFSNLAEITGREERLSNEVAILNIFTWTGIVGVLLYMVAFYRASFLAVRRSKSIYVKVVGLFVAFRWIYAWVEDINNFTLTNAFLWMMIGMCFSKAFRSMTNKEIKYWVRGIFDKRYRKMEGHVAAVAASGAIVSGKRA